MNIQELIFESVLEKFEKRSHAVEYLGKILDAGKDSVYRRLRGDTLLTPDEIAIISEKVGISLDQIIFQNSSKVVFSAPTLERSIKNNTQFLEGIRMSMESATKIPENVLYYASSDIPIFQSCYIPELISFKLFVWGRTVWDLDHLKDVKYSHDLLSQPDKELVEEISYYYNSVPSVELWDLNLLDNTLNQIEYYVNSADFAYTKEAFHLLDRLVELVAHMKNMARNGSKIKYGLDPVDSNVSFGLYHNELVHSTNTILSVAPAAMSLYAGIGNPNFIISNDQKMAEFKLAWFKKLISKSSPLSTTSEKDRNRYFNKLLRKIELVKKRIEVISGELI